MILHFMKIIIHYSCVAFCFVLTQKLIIFVHRIWKEVRERLHNLCSQEISNIFWCILFIQMFGGVS